MSRQNRTSDKLALTLLAITVAVMLLGALRGRSGLPSVGRSPAPEGTWVSGLDAPATLQPATAPGLLDVQPTPAAIAAATAGPAAAPAALPPSAPRVGILAGHWRFDSGAVCRDGLREVDVTTDVATRVKNLLADAGVAAEILPEHDPERPQAPLLGYRAEALVSLHADVCELPGYSGFKVARGTHSTTPAADDRLVACLNRTYAAATGLPRHEATISIDMTNYYVFREIHADTPAAIVELGFLLEDRSTLIGNAYAVAQGVANGVLCFLEGSGER